MDTLELIGCLLGLLYMYLEYKANVWLWPVGVLMPVAYVVIFYQHAFYANMTIHLYYVVASLYGWIRWRRSSQPADSTGQAFCRTTLLQWMLYSVCAAILFVLLYYLLRKTDSQVAWSDAFISSLSVVGMWMLACKQVEQWLVWIVVNAFSVAIYLHNAMYPTAVYYAVYVVVAVMGYFNWLRLYRQQTS